MFIRNGLICRVLQKVLFGGNFLFFPVWRLALLLTQGHGLHMTTFYKTVSVL